MAANTNGPANKGKGKAIAFLREHVNDADGPCLTWPMFRNPNGYGMFGVNGGHYWAHRYMCELANGPAPIGHEAAHSCGRGKDGCVHPKHLSWKTKSGNLHDAKAHGTHPGGRWGNKGQLTPAQVIEIRNLKGQKTQAEIAAMFGIKEPTLRDIFSGRTYRTVSS